MNLDVLWRKEYVLLEAVEFGLRVASCNIDCEKSRVWISRVYMKAWDRPRVKNKTKILNTYFSKQIPMEN